MIQTTGYEYDIFISFPRESHHALWVHEFFLSSFNLYLTEELGRPVNIYVDNEIPTGLHDFPERTKFVLSRSKILVPIWSIHYFQSLWCMAEFSMMLYREDRLEYRTSSNPQGLIYPVRLFGNGKFYPRVAQNIQALDCRNFNIVFDGYKQTSQYYQLLSVIKDWAPNVAEAISAAPPWTAEWLSKEWLEEPLKRLETNPDIKLPEPNFRLPSLSSDIA
jgi:hypothetical protein